MSALAITILCILVSITAFFPIWHLLQKRSDRKEYKKRLKKEETILNALYELDNNMDKVFKNTKYPAIYMQIKAITLDYVSQIASFDFDKFLNEIDNIDFRKWAYTSLTTQIMVFLTEDEETLKNEKIYWSKIELNNFLIDCTTQAYNAGLISQQDYEKDLRDMRHITMDLSRPKFSTHTNYHPFKTYLQKIYNESTEKIKIIKVISFFCGKIITEDYAQCINENINMCSDVPGNEVNAIIDVIIEDSKFRFEYNKLSKIDTFALDIYIDYLDIIIKYNHFPAFIKNDYEYYYPIIVGYINKFCGKSFFKTKDHDEMAIVTMLLCCSLFMNPKLILENEKYCDYANGTLGEHNLTSIIINIPLGRNISYEFYKLFELRTKNFEKFLSHYEEFNKETQKCII